jgi:hypothetical protein
VASATEELADFVFDRAKTSPLEKGISMKKVALALALVVTALSLGGCFVGKGKAPAPVITKG